MKDSYYIFTEIVNCGKIGKIALDSFHKYHNLKVHVFGTPDDFKWIVPNENTIFIPVEEKILKGYKKGHVGTALLWEKVITGCSTDTMIHFDSDVIFRESIIDDMLSKAETYDLIGPIRNYKHNPHGRADITHLSDICQTSCILFKKSKINLLQKPNGLGLTFTKNRKEVKRIFKKITTGMSTLAQRIHGTYNPFPFPTLDFFDPIMFNMLENGAKIYHLDFNQVGGWNELGSRDNIFREINNFPTPYKLDFGSTMVHFSCVGSGMNFTLHPETKNHVGKAYVAAALDRYALFCKIFYNEESTIDLSIYKPILEIPKWY